MLWTEAFSFFLFFFFFLVLFKRDFVYSVGVTHAEVKQVNSIFRVACSVNDVAGNNARL